ncbi:DMT family transporter [Stutzerimonas nitrititolerans]|uniref:DMT family transporter n=1 Tax=Stutzerimonas nitrititolerans TaxID=2482751 RepID=A0AA41WP95_9GAMM|nr:DMT family transporter [Stutzerimonas nitrititolerans]RRV22775.1 DMT family transporter [Pseudomonas sp. s199]WAD25780.1 DMT family transporter [Pseudomonadaceae bacterium T75]HAQ72525.1 EamA/RhaT family transporter [Pseudomonas sp.]MCO7545431.1 DMT family transporter [Stutzerimonas nitrititolerans]NNT93092.1 DMT family transporter [Stutzerimonas nitrititolerans]
MDNRHQSLYGVLLILLSGILLASHDGLSKYLTQLYPVFLVVWARYLAQVVLMLGMFAPRMGRRVFHTLRPWPQLLRGLSLVSVSIMFISGLRYIPLAEATAVIFLTPLMVTVASALLGERVSHSQWLAVGVGLLGVMIIVRPGGALFTPAVLLPFGAAISFTVYQLLTRRLSGTDHPVTSNFLSSLVGFLVMSVLVTFNWRTPSVHDAVLMASLGLMAMSGHLVLTQAFRYASAASLAPFTYGQIVFAGIVGFIAFGHIPDVEAIAGMTVIIASGLCMAYVQSRQASRSA